MNSSLFYFKTMAKQKIKLLTSLAGRGLKKRRGDIIEVDGDEAKRHIASGNAVAWKDESKGKGRGKTPVVETRS